MKTNFSMLFYQKKPKNYKGGAVPIYLRITIDGQRAETSTSRECDPLNWNPISGREKGTKESSRRLNAYLDDLQAQVYEAHRALTENREGITADMLKNKFLGKEEKPKMIMEIFQEHNDKFEKLVGKDVAAGTLERFKTSLRHTENFIIWKYKKKDLDIRRIDHEFITGYDFYLRSERKCANNSTVKYLRNFKKIVLICLNNGWIAKNPFLNYKGKVKKKKRICLEMEEIEAIASKTFKSARLMQVRDIFLFSCYTGLAYIDIKNLTRMDIVIRFDGEAWINSSRQKTDVPTRIPLLPQALDILKLYEDHPVCNSSGKVLPVLSNQKMNDYLKEIADLCDIEKVLTYHIARHTFATTVTVANDVPMESVSAMLGHTNLRTTQEYAVIINKKLSNDMRNLKNKFVLKDRQKINTIKNDGITVGDCEV